MRDIPHVIRTAKQELKKALKDYAHLLPPSLIEIGKLALSGPGKIMSAPEEDAELAANPPRWPLAVVLSYQAAAGPERRDNWHEAMPAAISVEIAMAAADLIDEISDEDPSVIVTRYGPGQALNTANLMLVMAQQILLRHALQKGEEEGENRALLALGALQEMLVEAAVGQHLDMLYQGMGIDQVTVEMSGEMTARKAGALIGGACRIGALMAGANPQAVELITRFGREIGGIAQLKNDLRDVLPSTDREMADAAYQPKTDLRLRKRTIPIVFALHDDSLERNLLQMVFNNQGEGADEEEMRQAVVSAGGAHFAQLVMDVHLQNASQALEELESLQPGASSALAHLLHSFDEQSD